MSQQDERAPSSRGSRVSYSELKVWNECPYKHKLIYIDKIKEFVGNEHTAFGHAIHDTCEKTLNYH